MKNWFKNNITGILFCLALALPAYLLGLQFPLVGGPVFGILCGMFVAFLMRKKAQQENSFFANSASGITFVGKRILQTAVVTLGFGLNLNVVLATGAQSLPIIITTITISLLIAFVLMRAMKIERNAAILVGVGSSICGGSAIAAAAPVIRAKNAEVAQAISVIFFFNIIAALVFPWLGDLLGFSHTSGEGFGIFAGTAVNDTSSVTAAAATWDSMWGLGAQTLDKAVIVKLTRTLAIIPITLGLALIQAKHDKGEGFTFSFTRAFPLFVLFFVLAAVATTIATACGISEDVFAPAKPISKFLIVLAMTAIGLNTDAVKLIRTGGKSLALGACCWIGITVMTLAMQKLLGCF